jgi:transposase
MAKPGRPERIGVREKEVLGKLAQEPASRSLREIAAELLRRTGVSAQAAMLRNALLALGCRRQRGEEAVRRIQREEAGRYGYTGAHRRQVAEQAYPRSLTDQEWQRVKDLFELPNPRGKPPQIPRREVLDACGYVVRTGGAWRMLPREFPPWDNVYKRFRRWRAPGRFELMHQRLAGAWREREGRRPEPRAAGLDAQSTRSAPQGGERGYDTGKKVKGRQCNRVVDTLGLVLAVTVGAAGLQDREVGLPAVEQAVASYPTLKGASKNLTHAQPVKIPTI